MLQTLRNWICVLGCMWDSYVASDLDESDVATNVDVMGQHRAVVPSWPFHMAVTLHRRAREVAATAWHRGWSCLSTGTINRHSAHRAVLRMPRLDRNLGRARGWHPTWSTCMAGQSRVRGERSRKKVRCVQVLFGTLPSVQLWA